MAMTPKEASKWIEEQKAKIIKSGNKQPVFRRRTKAKPNICFMCGDSENIIMKDEHGAICSACFSLEKSS